MASSESTPSSNTFSGSGDSREQEGVKFDAFSLSQHSSDDASSSSVAMPSLQSIQQQEIQMQQQQQQIASPEELRGPITDDTSSSSKLSLNQNTTTWHQSSSYNNNNHDTPNNTMSSSSSSNQNNNNNNQSFLSKLASCAGGIDVLRPYFDIDTADIAVRMKGSLQYVLVMDGFRNEVLYSDNAFRLAYRDTIASSASEGGGGDTPPALQTQQQPTSSSSSGKGPDLYGPIWITLTLVFFVAVTSNISLYIHHHHTTSIVDEGGMAAEKEWDYDINQLLHAMWILYSFSLGLPTLLYFLLRIVIGSSSNNNLGLVELICLYGYSLVPYLPVTWICVVPYNWVQWLVLSVATMLSGMLVLRNVVGSIINSSSGGGGGGGGMGGFQGKGGGLIMCVIGFHFVFFLVMKLAFYHHH